MKKQTPEQKQYYAVLVENARDLSSRVAAHQGPAGFDDFVEEHNEMLKYYVSTLEKFSLEEAVRGKYLLEAVKEQIHGTLDVYRVRDMRAAIMPTPEKGGGA